MFIEHPAFVDSANSNLKLWRYIELDKLISLLETSELFFCRADYFRLEDPFEGTFPKVEYEYLVAQQDQDFPRNLFNLTSRETFLNCWHLNENENLAMWKLYAREKKVLLYKRLFKILKIPF